MLFANDGFYVVVIPGGGAPFLVQADFVPIVSEQVGRSVVECCKVSDSIALSDTAIVLSEGDIKNPM